MFFFFFFNDTATTEIYTLSLHDALPISRSRACRARGRPRAAARRGRSAAATAPQRRLAAAGADGGVRTGARARASLHRPDRLDQLRRRLLPIPVQHARVVQIEQRVLDAGESRALAALDDD